MGGVDPAGFHFDPFLSWSLFFMNGDKTIYGRFGRAHPNSKMGKKDSNPNHTLDGMKAALRKARESHKGDAKKPDPPKKSPPRDYTEMPRPPQRSSGPPVGAGKI